jgi:uncharacterized membrane protein
MIWGKGGVQRILDNPWASLGAGLLAAAVLLATWLAAAGGDVLGLLSFLMRFLHVLAAAVWIGLIVFVNFIQLAVLRTADEGGRELLNRLFVPSLSRWLRHASTATVLAGVLLLATTGYLLPRLIYGSSVFVPVARSALLWPAVLGAFAMWMFVHMYIAPSMEVVLGIRPGDAAAKERARARIAGFARVNLILAVPVMVAMLAAAHLY